MNEAQRTVAVRLLIIACCILLCVGCDTRTPASQPSQRTAHQIAHSSDVDAMKALISQGLDPDATDRNGQSLLYVAVKGNHLEMVEYLLSAGASIDLKSQATGRTPLFQAAFDGYHEDTDDMLDRTYDKDAAPMVELLIAHGANVNSTNDYGWTPLHDAVAGKNPHVVRVLLKHGANPTAADQDGATPLDVAMRSGLDEIAKLLREDLQD